MFHSSQRRNLLASLSFEMQSRHRRGRHYGSGEGTPYVLVWPDNFTRGDLMQCSLLDRYFFAVDQYGLRNSVGKAKVLAPPSFRVEIHLL